MIRIHELRAIDRGEVLHFQGVAEGLRFRYENGSGVLGQGGVGGVCCGDGREG